MTRLPAFTAPRHRGLIACLAALALCSGCDREPTETPGATDRIEGWRQDLAFLRSEVPRVHPPPATDLAFTSFTAAIDALSDSVPSITDEAVVTGMQRILAGVGDGHTSLIPDDVGAVTFEALKVDFFWFDDGVHIASVRPGFGALLGARVTAVGGVPIDDFLARLTPFVPRDNERSLRWLGAQLMQYTGLIRATGAQSTDAGVPLDIVSAAGATQRVTVPSHSAGALSRLRPPGGESAATPLYLRNRDIPYWIDSLPADATLYVNFNAVVDDPAESLAAFATRVGTLLSSGRFPNLVLDVRFNNGGNNQLLPPLLQVIQAYNNASGSNRIFAIIGRATFSAGQNFVNQLERTTRAVFVGEETGSRPNFIGDGSNTPMPYSQVRVSIASKRYDEGGPGDLRPSVAPDIATPVLSTDYFANRDPAIDAVLSAIRGQ